MWASMKFLSTLRLIYNPGLALTVFRTTQPKEYRSIMCVITLRFKWIHAVRWLSVGNFLQDYTITVHISFL